MVGVRPIVHLDHLAMALQPCAPLDYETPLYQGCGASELYAVTSAAALICFPISIAASTAMFDGMHVFFVTFAIEVTCTLVLVTTAATVYRKIKFEKPEGWLLRSAASQIHPYLETQLVLTSGCWNLNRGDR